MRTYDEESGSEPAAAAAPRRGDPGWGHLPHALEVVYRGVSVGRYVADLVVDGKVIVETKVAKAIDPVHRAQVSNYLRASGLEVGLVINFGSSVQFKRVVASPHRVRDATRNQPSNDHSGTTARPDTDKQRSRRWRGLPPRALTLPFRPASARLCWLKPKELAGCPPTNPRNRGDRGSSVSGLPLSCRCRFSMRSRLPRTVAM